MISEKRIIFKNEEGLYESFFILGNQSLEEVSLFLYSFYRNKEELKDLARYGSMTKLGLFKEPKSKEHTSVNPEDMTCIFYKRDVYRKERGKIKKVEKFNFNPEAETFEDFNDVLNKNRLGYNIFYNQKINDFLIFKGKKFISKTYNFLNKTIYGLTKKGPNKRIVILGTPGAGKDTVSNFLASEYAYRKIKLASPIYEEAKKRGMKKKDRTLLQSVGKEFRRKSPTFLVEEALKKVTTDNYYVVDDCRDVYEYAILLLNGFIPIRIDASLEKRMKRIEKRDDIKMNKKEKEALNDRLEKELIDFPAIDINNNSTKEHLYQKVEKVII